MDEALGPGMPSGVGEDSYLLYRIVRAGWTVVYEPDGLRVAPPPRHRRGAGHADHELLLRPRRPPAHDARSRPRSACRPPPRPGRRVRRREPGRVARGSRSGAAGDRPGPAPRHAARPAQLRPLAAPRAPRRTQQIERDARSGRRGRGDGPSAAASAGRRSSPRRRSRRAAARRHRGAGDPARARDDEVVEVPAQRPSRDPSDQPAVGGRVAVPLVQHGAPRHAPRAVLGGERVERRAVLVADHRSRLVDDRARAGPCAPACRGRRHRPAAVRCPAPRRTARRIQRCGDGTPCCTRRRSTDRTAGPVAPRGRAGRRPNP